MEHKDDIIAVEQSNSNSPQIKSGKGSPNSGTHSKSSKIKLKHVRSQLCQKYGKETVEIMNPEVYDSNSDCMLRDNIIFPIQPTLIQKRTKFIDICSEGFGSCVQSWGIHCPIQNIQQVTKAHSRRKPIRSSYWCTTYKNQQNLTSVDKLPRNMVLAPGDLLDIIIDSGKHLGYLCISRWVLGGQEGSGSVSGSGSRSIMYLKEIPLSSAADGITNDYRFQPDGPHVKPLDINDIVFGCHVPIDYDVAIVLPGEESKYNLIPALSPNKLTQNNHENVYTSSNWVILAKQFVRKYEQLTNDIQQTQVALSAVPMFTAPLTETESKYFLNGHVKSVVHRNENPLRGSRDWEKSLAPILSPSRGIISRSILVSDSCNANENLSMETHVNQQILASNPKLNSFTAIEPILSLQWLKGIVGIIPTEAMQIGYLNPNTNNKIKVNLSVGSKYDKAYNILNQFGAVTYGAKVSLRLDDVTKLARKTTQSASAARAMFDELMNTNHHIIKPPNYANHNGLEADHESERNEMEDGISIVSTQDDFSHVEKKDGVNYEVNDLSFIYDAFTGVSIFDKMEHEYVCSSIMKSNHAYAHYVMFELEELLPEHFWPGRVKHEDIEVKEENMGIQNVKILGSVIRSERQIGIIMTLFDTKGKKWKAKIKSLVPGSDCNYLMDLHTSTVQYEWKKGISIYNEPSLSANTGQKLPDYTVYPPVDAVMGAQGPMDGMMQFIVRLTVPGDTSGSIIIGRYDALTETVRDLRPDEGTNNSKQLFPEVTIQTVQEQFHTALPDLAIPTLRMSFNDDGVNIQAFKEAMQHAVAHSSGLETVKEVEVKPITPPKPVAHAIPGLRVLRCRFWCFLYEPRISNSPTVSPHNYTCYIAGDDQYMVLRNLEFLCVKSVK